MIRNNEGLFVRILLLIGNIYFVFVFSQVPGAVAALVTQDAVREMLSSDLSAEGSCKC